MSKWNYVVTAAEPTSVTLSCAGNFTGPDHSNLITARGTWLFIHRRNAHKNELILKVPVYGRIASLELFRPEVESQDILFLATETEACFLQWDARSSKLVTLYKTEDLSTRRPTHFCQIGIIDPDCRAIGLYLCDGLFKVLLLDPKTGDLQEAFDSRLGGLKGSQVLDMKFLYGCSDNPTFVVISQDKEYGLHVGTFQVHQKFGIVAKHTSWPCTFGDLLIPVSRPLCGFLVTGDENISYYGDNIHEEIPKTHSTVIAYGRVDPYSYLLGDDAGMIHLLALVHENGKVTGLTFELLGETSIASTISYLGNSLVFVGSSYGDSQLIEINLSSDANGTVVKVLKSFSNLGPIVDFCVVDHERHGQAQVVTCSGAYKDGSVRIVDISTSRLETLRLGKHARCICHQAQTFTFGICTNDSEKHFVSLLDEKRFKVVATYPLDASEHGCSILSCMFNGDENANYYCVGTAYVSPEENEPTKGRILVFEFKEGKLQLIAEKETKGAVYSLNAFDGKLLASINQDIQLYKWKRQADDGTCELQFECGHYGHILALHVQTHGDFIVVGDLMNSISVLSYMRGEGKIEKLAQDNSANWMAAVEALSKDIYLGADHNFNLFTVERNSEGASKEEQGCLEVVGGYHLGDIVNRFCPGSLVMRLGESNMYQGRTIIFGTVSGMIGMIVSLCKEQYELLEKLQSSLRKAIKGVGGLSHEKWRSFGNDKKTVDATNFLDGDLIESFLDLSSVEKREICRDMNVEERELTQGIEKLRMLHRAN